MKRLLFTLLVSVPVIGIAQILGPEQMSAQPMFNKTFERLHSSAKINCGYFDYWDGTEGKVRKVFPITQKFSMQDKEVYAHYQVGDADLKITIKAGGERGLVSYELDGVKLPTYLSDISNIWFESSKLTDEHNELIKEYKLRELNCSLDIAKEDTFAIEQKDLHVAMHPYVTYDLDGESDPVIEEYLHKEMPQLLLLDDQRAARKGATVNFNDFVNVGHIPHDIEVRWLKTPKINIPENIPTRVAGAGVMKFKLTRPEHEVTYTGGNYNFCILNNNIKLVHALFDSPVTKQLQINYVTQGMVLQSWTFVNSLSFTKQIKKIKKSNFKFFKYSNLSANIFNKMQQEDGELDKYLDAHLEYFKVDVLSQRSQHFGTVTIKREGIYSQKIETIQGSGIGDYTLIFNYQ